MKLPRSGDPPVKASLASQVDTMQTVDAAALNKAAQRLAQKVTKSDKALNQQLTQEQVENITNKPIEKLHEREKTR